MFGDGRSRPSRGTGETGDVLRRMERGASLVDQQAVVHVAAELRPLVGARHELDAVSEHSREQRLLISKRAEMRRLPRGLQMAGAFVVAGDRLLRYQRFQRSDRVERDLEELSRAPLSEPGDERGGIELHAGDDLAAVA